MKKDHICFVNGKYAVKSKAAISVLDIGLTRGYGVFDFLVTYNNVPFMLDSHIRRLFSSASQIGLKIPWSMKHIKSVVQSTLNRNKGLGEKTIKIIVTGGVSSDGILPSEKPGLIVIIGDRHKYPDEVYDKGVSLITLDQQRDIPTAKSLNYSFAVQGLLKAKKSGAVDFIYVNKKSDSVYEASRSNIFIVKGRKVISPSTDILGGVTKETVSKLAAKYFIYVESRIKLDDLLRADEVFMTSSDKEIVPVVRIDGKKVGRGIPGEVTKRLMQEFKKVTKQA